MPITYLMESGEETERLEVKTDPEVVERQALMAGLRPGMRVADIGCGPGKTTAILGRLAGKGLSGKGGEAIGFDGSEERIEHARRRYGTGPLNLLPDDAGSPEDASLSGVGGPSETYRRSEPGGKVSFVIHDLRQPFPESEPFDFVWVRFLLEYHRAEAFDIVKNCASILKPGGTLCLIDLDHNCMSHYGISPRLEHAVKSALSILEKVANFDPYAGRKLYSHLYRLGFTGITAHVEAHHLIYGPLRGTDEMNWMSKITVIPGRINAALPGYGSIGEFQEDFRRFFTDPGRFSYTPLIACWGRKPPSVS